MPYDPTDDPVLIKPGQFNRRLIVHENAVMAILPPYLKLARTIARAKWLNQRIDWGKLYEVPDSRGGFSIAGPAIGAPNAVTMMETLIANGAKNIFVTGCCGSLSCDVKIGDILIPTSAISEEGTSAHYKPELHPPIADEELTGLIDNIAKEKGWETKKGPVWTTDAPYRETCEKVKLYGGKGVLGVEMELSAMFTVARFRGVKIAAALAVSDELASLQWRPGFLKLEFINATTRVIRLVLQAASRAAMLRIPL